MRCLRKILRCEYYNSYDASPLNRGEADEDCLNHLIAPHFLKHPFRFVLENISHIERNLCDRLVKARVAIPELVSPNFALRPAAGKVVVHALGELLREEVKGLALRVVVKSDGVVMLVNGDLGLQNYPLLGDLFVDWYSTTHVCVCKLMRKYVFVA